MDLPDLPLECTCGEREYLKEHIKRLEYVISALDSPSTPMSCGHKFRYIVYDGQGHYTCAICERDAALLAATKP